jgi:hypothetical protein
MAMTVTSVIFIASAKAQLARLREAAIARHRTDAARAIQQRWREHKAAVSAYRCRRASTRSIRLSVLVSRRARAAGLALLRQRDGAARRIQAFAHASQLKHTINVLRQHEQARVRMVNHMANEIQRTVRGWQARVYVKLLKDRMRAAAVLRAASAVAIQRFYRHAATMRIVWQGSQQRMWRLAASIKIQSIMRMKIARHRVGEMLLYERERKRENAALTIQRQCRVKASILQVCCVSFVYVLCHVVCVALRRSSSASARPGKLFNDFEQQRAS